MKEYHERFIQVINCNNSETITKVINKKISNVIATFNQSISDTKGLSKTLKLL